MQNFADYFAAKSFAKNTFAENICCAKTARNFACRNFSTLYKSKCSKFCNSIKVVNTNQKLLKISKNHTPFFKFISAGPHHRLHQLQFYHSPLKLLRKNNNILHFFKKPRKLQQTQQLELFQ